MTLLGEFYKVIVYTLLKKNARLVMRKKHTCTEEVLADWFLCI